MTEKRFKLRYINEQHISANLYDNETFIGSIGIGAELIVELLNTLSDENEQLKKENQGIQNKIMRLLDFVEIKQCVTRTEIKKWWNGDVE